MHSCLGSKVTESDSNIWALLEKSLDQFYSNMSICLWDSMNNCFTQFLIEVYHNLRCTTDTPHQTTTLPPNGRQLFMRFLGWQSIAFNAAHMSRCLIIHYKFAFKMKVEYWLFLFMNEIILFLAHRFLSPWWWRWYVPPKCHLQKPHSITSQKMTFFNV
jgi:hypothetical protein